MLLVKSLSPVKGPHNPNPADAHPCAGLSILSLLGPPRPRREAHAGLPRRWIVHPRLANGFVPICLMIPPQICKSHLFLRMVQILDWLVCISNPSSALRLRRTLPSRPSASPSLRLRGPSGHAPYTGIKIQHLQCSRHLDLRW